jgi:hypothetical protein
MTISALLRNQQNLTQRNVEHRPTHYHRGPSPFIQDASQNSQFALHFCHIWVVADTIAGTFSRGSVLKSASRPKRPTTKTAGLDSTGGLVSAAAQRRWQRRKGLPGSELTSSGVVHLTGLSMIRHVLEMTPQSTSRSALPHQIASAYIASLPQES